MDPGAVSQLGGLALLGTALTLGLRHGIDWDHLAAITDITGTTTTTDAARAAVAPGKGRFGVAAPFGRGAGAGALFEGRVDWRAVGLASLYAFGHALVVVALGLAALLFGAVLPEWVDPLMERLVGVTLVLLGVWVAYSLVRYWRGEQEEFRLRSRWMLVFDGLGRARHAVEARLHGHSHDGRFHLHAVARTDQYGPKTALGTGLIHGIGAETGTQVLLIAAVGGAASQGLGVGMLLAFVFGLLISNTAVALLTSSGFISAGRARSLYVAAGCLTAVFSLVVGGYALAGAADRLPDLQAVLSAVFGEPPA
jgi:hypothetical protein